jgi:REP element-mobilizing transposase RayT
MRLNETGCAVMHAWDDLPNHYLHAALDAFTMMPNHVHGIVILTDNNDPGLIFHSVGAGFEPAPTRTVSNNPMPRHGLPEIIRAFKTFSARQINVLRKTPGTPVWQRNYYEHIVRNDDELNRIRQYIADNPLTWQDDRENPNSRHEL